MILLSKVKRYTFFGILMILSDFGCSSTRQTIDYGHDAYVIQGTMHYLNIEGGCWQFRDEHDNTYQLVGEHITNLLTDGIKAKLIVRDAKSIASICMVGKLITILEIINITQP